jgi:hypothetical protein
MTTGFYWVVFGFVNPVASVRKRLGCGCSNRPLSLFCVHASRSQDFTATHMTKAYIRLFLSDDDKSAVHNIPVSVKRARDVRPTDGLIV